MSECGLGYLEGKVKGKKWGWKEGWKGLVGVIINRVFFGDVKFFFFYEKKKSKKVLYLLIESLGYSGENMDKRRGVCVVWGGLRWGGGVCNKWVWEECVVEGSGLVWG